MSASTPPHTKVVGDCSNSTVRPAQIIVACADAGYTVLEIDYHSWTDRRASGSATVAVTHGKPSWIGRYPVRFALLRPRSWHGDRLFSKLAVTYTQGEGPLGHHRESYQLMSTWFG